VAEALIERVRNFWNARPCNIRHSQAPIGTKEYFDEVRFRRYFVEHHIPGFAGFHASHRQSVLEIGCGIGTDAAEFARHSADVTGTDLSVKSLELARQRFQVLGLRGEFHEANAERLSETLPVKPYDIIYSFGVIHHTPNPGNVLAELRKYCHEETSLRIMLYAKWSWKVLWIMTTYGKGAFWRWREFVAQYSEAQEGSPVTYVYSAREARKLFEDRGFEVTEIRKDFIFPYEIPAYREHRYRKVWYFRWIPQMLFRQLQRLLGWHLLITARPR
jgi:SAM-dependent methyltransferase